MKHNHDRLAEIAQTIVQKSGLKGLSFRTLADEIGIKSSSVHYHFPEKSDLAETLIERYTASVFQSLAEIAASRKSLKQKIVAFIAIFEEVANHDRVCLCAMMAAEVETLSPVNRVQLASFFCEMEKWLTQLLKQNTEHINTTLPADTIARSMISGLEGAMLLDRVVGNSQRIKAQKALFLAIIKQPS